MGGVKGGQMQPIVIREWIGHTPDTEIEISINSAENPPLIPDDIRKAYRGIVADTDNFKRKVAIDQLGLARDWAEEGGINIALDEDIFAKLLAIDAFSVDPGRLTIWLSEGADIFAGHAIEVRIEDGEIIETCLAG